MEQLKHALGPLGDDGLAFKDAFRASLGNISLSTFHRLLAAGSVPPPEARVGRRPVWLVSTVRATVARLVASGDSGKPVTPKSGGRCKKGKAMVPPDDIASRESDAQIANGRLLWPNVQVEA